MNKLNEFSNLLCILKTKGIEVQSSFEGRLGEPRFIKVNFSLDDMYGWIDLIDRLNIVYENPFKIVIQNNEVEVSERSIPCAILIFRTDISNNEKLKEETAILANAIEHDEYKTPVNYDYRPTFDLKLGISCNNNCIHCVIKPHIRSIQKQYPESIILDSGIGMQSLFDLSYEQVVNTLSQETEDSHKVVLTGGEPTIRNDFIPIVKWLYYNRPNGAVVLQTNGRKLANKNLVKVLRRYTRNISIIVAVHGLEETHNKVVNNRKEIGNPFQQTIQGIKNILEVFPTYWVRILMVMTSFNIREIFDSVRFQYEALGTKSISITYPDFPGFNNETIQKLAPSATDIISVMRELNEYAKDKEDLHLSFIETPPCFFNQLGNTINISTLGLIRRNVVVNFLGSQNNDYDNYFKSRFEKSEKCSQCILKENCIGVYRETKDLREPAMEPVYEISPQFRNFLKRAGWQAL